MAETILMVRQPTLPARMLTAIPVAMCPTVEAAGDTTPVRMPGCGAVFSLLLMGQKSAHPCVVLLRYAIIILGKSELATQAQ